MTVPSQPNPITLDRVAHARSGDKGAHANIGAIAYTQAGYAFLQRVLTADAVHRHFEKLGVTRVERFELPKIRAFNFVLYDALAGGASTSLRIDTQGKLLSTALLEMKLPRPLNLAELERPGKHPGETAPLPARGPGRARTAPAAPSVAVSTPRKEALSMNRHLVRMHVHEHTGTIVLGRPDKRNALSRELIGEISQALAEFHHDQRIRAVVLTGSGAAFCAGMDLHEMLAASRQADAMSQWHADAVAYRDLVEQLLRFPKPMIAAVNGPAIAGGAGLVLASDIVVAADTATFGLPEPRRGIVAGMVAPLLAFRAGAGQAARLLLSAEAIDAAEAHRIGLFHKVVKPDQLWPQANELGAQCAKSAPSALLLTKQVLNETIGEHLFTQLGAGAAASATARTTVAAAEGLAAFLEKRDPNWQ